MDEDDAKLWGNRISYWVLSTVDCTILGKFVGGLFGTKSSHPLPWIILFVIVTAASIYFWSRYRHYKTLRKTGGSSKTPEQIEIETLAAYGAQQAQTPVQPTTPPSPPTPQAQSAPPVAPTEKTNWHS